MRFGFLVNEVLTGLRRNITMTIAMILTTAISLGLFGAGLLIVRLADHTREMYLDRVSSQVFLTPELSASDPGCDGDVCKAIREAIHARPEFKGEVFVDSKEAGAEALKRNPQFKGLASETVEGIRALAVDKDHQPRWNPAQIAEVTPEQVAAFFASPWPAHAHPLAAL